MRLVMMGPPGAGKGTQSALLATRLGVPHLSSGDMLRSAIAAGTPAGLAAKNHMDAGSLAPEHVILDVIRTRIGMSDCDGGFILDGFPRQVTEAIALDGMLADLGTHVDLVIHVDVPSTVVRSRIVERARSAQTARLDDDDEAVERRLRIYATATEPVLARYSEAGMLCVVDGTSCIDVVEASVLSALATRDLVAGDGPVP